MNRSCCHERPFDHVDVCRSVPRGRYNRPKNTKSIKDLNAAQNIVSTLQHPDSGSQEPVYGAAGPRPGIE